MKIESSVEWDLRLALMTDEQIVDAIKNKLPKDKTPILRELFVKEHIRRYKKASEKNDQ